MMKFLSVIATPALLITLSATAQTAPNPSASTGGSAATTSAAGNTTIAATLSKSIDAKKAKVGDEVTAKTLQELRSASGVVIPKGSKLIGHVTDAKARAKGDSQSTLAIAFDNLVLKNGQQIPLHANIQALAAPANNAPVPLGDDTNAGVGAPASPAPMAGRGNGGMAGPAGTPTGVANTAGVNPPPASANTSAGATDLNNGELSSSSTGVIGLKGIQLNAAGANNAQGSTITSSGKDLKLSSGTRMVLQVVQ
jgi:hypothetical protein